MLATALALTFTTVAQVPKPLEGVGTIAHLSTVDGPNGSGTAACLPDPRVNAGTLGQCALFPAGSRVNAAVIIRADGVGACGPTPVRAADSLTTTQHYFSDAHGGMGAFPFIAAGERYDMRPSYSAMLERNGLLASPHAYVGLCATAVKNGGWPGGLHAPCSADAHCNTDAAGADTCVLQATVSPSVWEAMRAKAGMYIVCESHAADVSFFAVTEGVATK